MKNLFLLGILMSFSLGSVKAQKDLLARIENHIYTSRDSTTYYLEQIYSETDKKKDPLLGFKGTVLGSISSHYFRDFETMQSRLYKAQDYLDQLPKKIDTLTDGLTAYRIYFNHYRANYHYTLHDIPKAKQYYLKTLALIEEAQTANPENNYIDFVAITNSYLAVIYQREFKYDIAIAFYTENLRIYREQEEEPATIYDVKNLMASLYSDQEDFKRSNRMAKESISFYLRDGVQNNPKSFQSTSLMLIGNYIDQNQIDSAQYYLDKLTNTTTDQSYFASDFTRFKAIIAQGQGRGNEAVQLYRSVIDSFTVNRDTPDEQSRTYRDLGKALESMGQVGEAITAYDTSLSYFMPRLSNTDSLRRPAYRMFNLFETLKLQSQLYNRQEDYDATLQIGKLTAQKLDDFKRSFTNDQDKQYLVDHVLPIFEACVEAAYQRYIITKDSDYLEKAFSFFELSKSPILMDALYRNNASSFKGVPAALIEEEKLLKRSISLLENALSSSENQKKASELFQLKRAHEQLIKQIETDYPAYYELKYSSETISLSQFQERIGKTTALSYFYGNEALYVLTIQSDAYVMDKIPLSRKHNLNIPDLNALLARPDSDPKVIAQLSHTLFQKLVPEKVQTSQNKKLLILPDGLLHTFPFEILSTDGSPENLLIHNYVTSYVNSATLWAKLQGSYKTKKSLVAFAPDFGAATTSTFDLADLPNNKEEVKQINTHFKGLSYLGQDATLAHFKKELGEHSIIHLATHAVTNDEVPEYSFLAFADPPAQRTAAERTTGPAAILYINDLYLEKINANLVTLSACKTGVGTIEKGEGMMSLSRAFFYGGAKSLVYSLWNTNDYATSVVITDFYENLSEGAYKDDALRQAKLNFLAKHKDNALTHPYYWSGFVVNGNATPVKPAWDWKWLWAALPALLLLLIAARLLLKRFQ